MLTELPIAEEFHSIQGEGDWVGTPMHFIRVAGCNVGRKRDRIGPFVCTNFDDRNFACDTNYARKSSYAIKDAIKDTWEEHICITGGEPFQPMYGELLRILFLEAHAQNKLLHFETSGTQPIPEWAGRAWVTMSPKKGWLKENLLKVDEVKLLVGTHTEIAELDPFRKHPHVFLSPINPETGLDEDSLRHALELLKFLPTWRLSVQLHKYLGLR